MRMALQLADMTSLSNFFRVVLFPLSSLIIGSSFLSISSLILELKKFSFFKGLTQNFQTQVSALTETISYDIDNFIDKTPIEEIRH